MRISDWSSDVCSSDLAVSPHIGDCAILIELLRNPHGMAGGKAKLARGLLLQRGCCEGGRRIAGERLGFDAFNLELPRLYVSLGGERIAFLAQRQLLYLLPLPADQACSRSEEHTSELQSLMRISYAVFCLKKKT